MSDVNTDKFRSLKSFGVSGVLREDAEIFYSTLFNSQHIGKISDLLVAKMKNTEKRIDELSLRALIAVCVFQGCRSQNKENSEVDFGGPLVFECGLDEKAIAVGVSFILSNDVIWNNEGFVERVFNQKPNNAFERVLAEYQLHSDEIILRYQPSTRKMEIISMIWLSAVDKLGGTSKNLRQKKPIELVIFENAHDAQSPAPKTYTELGDLNYSKLLQKARSVPETPREEEELKILESSQVETEVKSVKETVNESVESSNVSEIQNKEESRKVKGNYQNLDELIRVKGVPEDLERLLDKVKRHSKKEELQTLIRSKDERKSEVVRIKGKLEKNSDDEYFIVPGSSSFEKVKSFARGIKKGIHSFFRKLTQSESDANLQSLSEKNESIPISSNRIEGQIQEIENRESDSKDQLDALEEAEKGSELSIPESEENGFLAGEETEFENLSITEENFESYKKNRDDPILEAEKLFKEMNGGNLENILKKFDQAIKAVRHNVNDKKMEDRFNTLMSELVSERNRIADLAKNVNLSVRLKEFEFSRQEGILNNELKKKDALIAQRNTALLSARDKMMAMAKSIDKFKSSPHSHLETTQLKNMLNISQKRLTASNEENGKLQKKVDELKSQLIALSSSLKLKPQPSAADEPSFREKYHTLSLQADAYRKANRQLQEKVEVLKAEREKAVSVEQSEELKRRLEAAMKLTAVKKMEVEELRKHFEATHKNEANLRGEIVKLQAEVNQLKLAQKHQALERARLEAIEKNKKKGGGGGAKSAA